MRHEHPKYSCFIAALIAVTTFGCVEPLPADESTDAAMSDSMDISGSGADISPTVFDVTHDPRPALAPCAVPMTLVVEAGLADNYLQPGESANLTPAILAGTGLPDTAQWVGFDSPAAERHFGHTFDLEFDNWYGYQYGYLTIRLRPKSMSQWNNDTLSLWSTGTTIGWGTSLISLPHPFAADKETIVTLDLKSLAAGGSTVLNEINASHDLHVYLQDDMSVDSMRLTLSCHPQAGPLPNEVPLVGVLMADGGCGAYSQYSVFLDNEDKKNANGRNGWIGAVTSNKNTQFELCAVNGDLFTPVAQAGASFALVALAGKCPEGFVQLSRFHDNEDKSPASWDNTPAASPTVTIGPKKDTNMAFCISSGNKPVANAMFPEIGIGYGVFGGRTPAYSPWALARGWIHLDDEDKNNKNQPTPLPIIANEFITSGSNTDYYIARVK